MEISWKQRGREAYAASKKTADTLLATWYETYATDVLRYCFLFLGNRADAEDAAQETFLKAWRNLNRFEARNGCSAKSWLMRIAGNACRDMLRKPWKKHGERMVTPEEMKKWDGVSAENRELVLDVMNLPLKYRQVILLFYWQGMSMEEIAACMQASKSTVRRWLKKAEGMLA